MKQTKQKLLKDRMNKTIALALGVISAAVMTTRAASVTPEKTALPPQSQPAVDANKAAPFAYREFLGLAHFCNSYEVSGDNLMRDVFKEAKFWGFNGYGDYYNTFDHADPLEMKNLYQDPARQTEVAKHKDKLLELARHYKDIAAIQYLTASH